MKILVLDEELYADEDLEPKHPGDAGIDLRVAETVKLRQGETKKVSLGVAIALPPGTVGWITSRSSAALKGMTIHEGKIDEGYRGAIHAIITNHHASPTPFTGGAPYHVIERGAKVCQLLVLPIVVPAWEIVDSLDETSRGSDGFGSTD